MFLAEIDRLLTAHHARWRAAVVVAMAVAAIQSAATVIRPLPIKALIEPDATAGPFARAESLAASNAGRIALFATIIVAIEVVVLAARYATELVIVGATERIIRSIRRAIMGNLLRGPYASIGAGGPGAVLAAASGDLESVQRLLREAIVATGVSVLQLALMLLVVLVVETWLFWFLAAEIAVLSGGIALYAAWRKKRYLIKMAIEQSFLGYLATVYQRNLDIRFSALRTMFLARTTALARRLYGVNRLLWMRHSLYHGAMEFVISLSTAASLILLLLFAGDGPPPIGTFLVFAYYAMLIFPCLGQIGEAWPMVLDARAALERIGANTTPAAPAVAAAPPRAAPRFGRIVFDEVTLLNPRGEPILDRVSFALEPGAKLGIFGESGSGKTSILSLLLGLNDAHGGRVTIDGRDARELTLADRKRMFFLLRAQAAFLPATVRDNIVLTRAPHADALGRVVERARLGGRFPPGADLRHVPVSDKGEPFSAGEQQRIAIARAFLADQPCLVFDEALNSLDEAAELAITQAMLAVLEEKTILLVSHRRRVAELFSRRLEVVRGGRASLA
jgi:ABC-type multidrug transport system fused ATPase/permease subunit